MKYSEFLRECRNLACERLGRAISPAEFADMLIGDDGRPYGTRYYSNCERGEQNFQPGRPMLEQAAALAGFSFEDCIRFPNSDQEQRKTESAEEIFRLALRSWKRSAALEAASDIAVLKRSKRPRPAGSGRKKRQAKPTATIQTLEREANT